MAKSIRCASGCKARHGFTLIEMSLVLIVIGLVILIVFPALQAVRDGTQRSTTIANLNTLMRASAAFVQANGCLPCPMPASTGPNGFGRVRGDAAGPSCGTCAIAEGITPFVSLGLPAATARDGWGRWITMRIDPDLAINFGVVPPTAPCTASDPAPCTLGASQKGLCRTPPPAPGNRILIQAPGSTTSQYAALVFVSHGPNGFGAYRASPQNPPHNNIHPAYGGPPATCSTTSGFELCNVNGDAQFTASEMSAAPSAPFDDTLLFMGRNALVSLLGNGACQTVWE